jgi:endonuclease/exonuclease/phosphatase family metal-dependent hydrolase
LRIASYNVQNLYTEADAGRQPKATAKPGKGIQALAGTLGALAADAVLLQEVGSAEALALVNERLEEPYPFAAVVEGNSERGIHLAVLSREPFQVTSHRHLRLGDEAGLPLLDYASEAAAGSEQLTPLQIQRDLLQVDLDLADAGTLTLFNVHLKSKTNRPWRQLAADDVRAAEARQVAQRLAAYLLAYPERPLLLGGDLNDLCSSESLAPLFGLPLLDPMGEQLAQTGANPSTYWPKRRMRLDFLLLSPAAARLLVPNSARIHADQRAKRASDHYPISVDLEFDHLAAT